MRWLWVAAACLAFAVGSEGSVGVNSAGARGQTYSNARAIMPYQGGNTDQTSLGDDSFWVPTSLANPVWRGAANAQTTAFAVPKESGTFRVRISSTSGGYGSTCIDNAAGGNNCITACYKARTTIGAIQDIDGTCNVTGNDRVDFILGGGTDIADRRGPNLAQGTRYHYVLERLEPGGTWSRQPEFTFTTLTSTAAADQHFVYVSDEHSTQLYSKALCGTATQGTDDRLAWDRFRQTQQNILANNTSHNYLFYLSTGDNALTHSGDSLFNACGDQMGKSIAFENPNLANACATQNECDARWILYLWTVQPVTKYIPLVLTLGNHEGESLYADAVTDLTTFAGLNGSVGYWYFDATNNLDVYSRNARLKYLPNPDFTYTGTSGAGSANGNYFSLASGSLELIVGDIERGPTADLDGDLNPREWPDDFPGSCPGDTGNDCTIAFPNRGWNDWTYGAAQCGFLTGTSTTACNGTTGRLGAVTGLTWLNGANTINVKWKMLTSHHSAGSDTGVVNGAFYGRGGMGNTVRFCTSGENLGVGTTQCTLATDCDISVPIASDACGGSVSPNMLGTLNGTTQANLQAQAETFRTAAAGASFFLYGHDHLSTCAQKYRTGPTATGVFYCEGTQPGADQQGPGWVNNARVEVTYDWGGTANGSDQIPDYCTPPSVAAMLVANDTSINGCAGGSLSANSFGSTIRGYLDVRVNGTTNVTVTQYSSIVSSEAALLEIEPNNTAEWTFTAP